MEKHRGSVIVVDDDPLVLMNNSDLLEDAGYVTSQASCIEQAWGMVRSRRFDFMLCDHDLTDGKGLTLIRRMSEAGINIPVIYLSAATPVVLEEVARESLVKKVLSKPVDKNALYAAAATLEPHAAPAGEERYPRLVGDDERRKLLDSLI